MKTTTPYYDKLNESGERLFTAFILVAADGTSHDITNRVRDHSDLDEDVEDEALNVGGGDIVLLLDNRDRYFVGDHQGGGLFDGMTWGTWQLFTVRGFQKAPDSLGSFRGVVAPGFERLDNGYRVQITALSFSSYAKRISAWDGTDAGRLVYNQPIADLTRTMLSRIDPNGIYPGEGGSTLDADIELPTLPGSDRFYQAFDSTVEPEGRSADGMVQGPRKLYWMRTDGTEEWFWLDSKSAGVSWGLAYDKADGTWRLLQIEFAGSYLGGAVEPLFEGLADPDGASKRYWFVKPGEIHAWSMRASGTPAVSLVKHRPLWTHTAYTPVCFTPSTSGALLYYVEWESRGNGTVAHFRAYSIDRATGNRSLLVRVAIAPDVNLVTAGYRYLGLDGVALTAQGAVMAPSGDQLIVFTTNSVFSHMITANTTVRVRQPAHPGATMGWRIIRQNEDDPVLRWSRFQYVRAGDWWGMIAWRGGTFTGDGLPPRGVMADNFGGHPSYSEWIDPQAFTHGFGPEDGIGLLPADHPQNPTEDDERIEYLDEIRIDVHLTASDRTRFTALWRNSALGLGNRSYTLREPPSNPHVSGDLPDLAEDYRTALVTSDFDFARGGFGVSGERMDGLSSLPSEFFLQMIAQGPGGSPVDENRRMTVLVRTSVTVPVVHRAELVGATAWDIITRSLQAANSRGVFRWDESLSKLVFYVRGRTRRDAHQTIAEEYDFEVAETERFWEHVYDGVTITGGLGQTADAGDVTSPNSRILVIQNDFISPSLVEAIAEDYRAFFTVVRRVFKLTLRDRPHWEMLDRLGVYLLNDRGNYWGVIMGRRVQFDRDRADLFLVEDL